MIPILSSEQIRECDKYTIEETGISSLELMERASISFTNKFRQLFEDNFRVVIVTGVGNNGGDGLAIARLLKAKHYKVKVYSIGKGEKSSPDFKANQERFPDKINWIEDKTHFPKLDHRDIVVDSIFGSGLSRPIEGLYADLISFLNDSVSKIVSVDIASGLRSNESSSGAIIEPMATLTFQMPKLAFFQPELGKYVGDLHVIPIGLDKYFVESQKTKNYFLEKSDIADLLKPRDKYSHKADFGRARLIAGSHGKLGAAVLAAKAILRSGAGLLHTLIPESGMTMMLQSVPETMIIPSDSKNMITEIPTASQTIQCTGIGPGLGTHEETVSAFKTFLEKLDKHEKLVIDADGINMLAQNPSLLDLLPQDAILTPHPGEFRRLVGDWSDDFDKIEKLRELCTSRKLNMVLKGANSAVCDSEGNVVFNDSGNPGMATAGSGDVLLGVITGLVSQGMEPSEALLTGVFVHGMAGDLAANEFGERSMIASDIIDQLPMAFMKISS